MEMPCYRPAQDQYGQIDSDDAQLGGRRIEGFRWKVRPQLLGISSLGNQLLWFVKSHGQVAWEADVFLSRNFGIASIVFTQSGTFEALPAMLGDV